MKKIAVFGVYHVGNFGDEVMGIMVARHIRDAGYQPCVYQLAAVHAKAEGLDTVDTIQELVSGCEAIVLGGGGWLVSPNARNRRARVKLDAELGTLAYIAQRDGIPIHAVSLGGDGLGKSATMLPGTATMLASPMLKTATVRLKSDLELFEALHKSATQFPDIVFDAPRFWPARDTAPEIRPLAIHGQGGLPRCRVLTRVLKGLTRFRRKAATIAVNSFSRESGRSDIMPVPGVERRDYSTIADYAQLLSNVHVLVSSKLHLGVFAMAYGRPFLSYYGEDKTRQQLQELGLDVNYFTRDRLVDLVRASTGPEEGIKKPALDAHDSINVASRGHFDALDTFLKSL